MPAIDEFAEMRTAGGADDPVSQSDFRADRVHRIHRQLVNCKVDDIGTGGAKCCSRSAHNGAFPGSGFANYQKRSNFRRADNRSCGSSFDRDGPLGNGNHFKSGAFS